MNEEVPWETTSSHPLRLSWDYAAVTIVIRQVTNMCFTLRYHLFFHYSFQYDHCLNASFYSYQSPTKIRSRKLHWILHTFYFWYSLMIIPEQLCFFLFFSCYLLSLIVVYYVCFILPSLTFLFSFFGITFFDFCF